jgi:four helix bundle protein
MSKINHFTDLEIWRKSHDLFLHLLEAVERFPSCRGARIVTDQVLRSAGSVGANISEGFDRSKRQFLNYLDIAKGSCYETENWLYKIRDAKYLTRDRANDLLREVITVNKMIHSLMRKIR